MKYEKEVSNAKFVFTKDEIGYQEVIDDFINSNYILVITFNISENNDYLINHLKESKTGTEIEIFTNIPQRYERYFSDAARQQARKKINVYLDRLDPKKYESLVSTHFCFNNHSKIILTDNVVYIGSANYSDESQRNSESGFIVRDQHFITFIKKNIVPFLKDNSEPYYSDNATRLKILLSIVYSKFINSFEDIHMSTHSIHDHAGREFEFFSIHDNRLKLSTIETLYSDLEELQAVFNVISDELAEEELLSEDLQKHLNVIDIDNLQELITYDTSIYELAKFDEDEFAMEYLQENIMEAYDENLAHFQDLAVQNANEEKSELASLAEKDILSLLSMLKKLQDTIENILNEIPSGTKNSKIDNT